MDNSIKTFTFGGQDYSPGMGIEATQPDQQEDVERTQFNSEWVANFIKEAPAKYGISSEEAKYLTVQQIVAVADERNDETLLDVLDPKFFTPKTQQFIADSKDKIFNERKARETYERQQADLEATSVENERKLYVEQRSREAIIKAARGDNTVAQLTSELLQDPQFTSDDIKSLMGTLNSFDDTYTDPARETMELSSFRSALVKSTLGLPGFENIDELAATALQNVRSPASRAKLADMIENAEQIGRDRLFDGLDAYRADVRQAFPSGVGEEQSLARTYAGESQARYYEPNVDTLADGIFEDHYMGLASDWYAENPDASRMPYSVKRELAETATEWAIADGRRMYQGYTADGVSPGTPQEQPKETKGDDPLTRLKGLAAAPEGDTGSDHKPADGVSAGRGGNR